jgi:sporulation protein YlmC with PRC-barrel domain
LKAFFTDLQGKTVMTKEGEILGTLEDFIADSRSARIESMLIAPSQTVEPRLFKQDAKGRILLPFRAMRAVRDVIVIETTE